VAAPPPVAAPATPPPAPVATAPARSTTLVAISTPQPPFPPEALRAGVTGEVEVEISISADGSVADIRVIRASPRNTFERGVQNTVRRWRFQPIAAPTTIRRTFTFRQ
jgi:protein TonB